MSYVKRWPFCSEEDGLRIQKEIYYLALRERKTHIGHIWKG